MSFFKRKVVHSRDSEDIHRIIDSKTPFAVAEAFKSLYTKILYLPIDDECKKIVLTSAVSGEAKTYVSCNLAITLAQNSGEKRVLLVDLDMRKPRIKRLIKKFVEATEDQNGLSEYLAGITEAPCIVETTIPNLDVLFSGKECSNPTGLINSSRMQGLFDYCKGRYDYVIIDSPPTGLVSDAILLADKVNGYIVTARADFTNSNSLAEAVDTLQNIGAEVFGVVFSSVNPKKIKGNSYSKKTSYY